MGTGISMTSLRNYRNLVEKIDALCRRITTGYGEFLACGKGCDDCCRHISLFPVEAFALTVAIADLPGGVSEYIRDRARRASSDACPLLENGLCLLYTFRPIICRTHGFPLLSCTEGKKVIDYCPKNFMGVTSLPADIVLNLDNLNTTLAAINAVFIASSGNSASLEDRRISIAEALLLEA
jgi:hypothetical protein